MKTSQVKKPQECRLEDLIQTSFEEILNKPLQSHHTEQRLHNKHYEAYWKDLSVLFEIEEYLRDEFLKAKQKEGDGIKQGLSRFACAWPVLKAGTLLRLHGFDVPTQASRTYPGLRNRISVRLRHFWIRLLSTVSSFFGCCLYTCADDSEEYQFELSNSYSPLSDLLKHIQAEKSNSGENG